MTARNQVVAVVLVLGLAGLVDFVTRVYVPRAETERGLEPDVAIPPTETRSLAEARQRLQSWLPEQRTAATEGQAGTPVGETGETNSNIELPDRGKLGGRLYVLRGIFETEGGPPFAVLEVTPESGGQVERHDVLAGDDIGGVHVDLIDGRRIVLSKEGELIQLTLFLAPGAETVAADESE